MPMCRRVLIFGASVGGRRCFQTLSEDRQAIAFIDNDPKKEGMRICGLPVYSPEQIFNLEFSEVLVASVHADAIIRQLEGLGVSSSSIVRVERAILDGRRETCRPVPRTVVFGMNAEGRAVARLLEPQAVCVAFSDFDPADADYVGFPVWKLEVLPYQDFDQVVVALREPARAVQQLCEAGVPNAQVRVVETKVLERPPFPARAVLLLLGAGLAGFVLGLGVALIVS